MGFFISFFGVKETKELIINKIKIMFSNLRSLIFKLDPEKAHDLAIKSLKFNLVPNVFQDENKDELCLKQNYLTRN